MASTQAARPETHLDVFGSELADDPFGAYRALRDEARAVYVPAHDCWLITQYDDVRSAAIGWRKFTSAEGVALLPDFNAPMLGSILAVDPPRHTELKEVLSEQLSPKALEAMRTDITARVTEIVDDALTADEFDAARGLAHRIPVEVVSDLIGIPEDDRELLLPGADAVFTTFGPFTPLLESRMGAFMAYLEFTARAFNPERLRPGSWGAHVFEAVDAGRITAEAGAGILQAYLVAGMDTTANGLASLMAHFARNPETWSRVREDRTLAGPAFEEILRLESPVLGFFRVATEDIDYGDVIVPEGARVFLHFASANRDERHYPDPDTFILDRNPIDHLAFGAGVHVCAGQGLARIEARALVEALAERVETIELAGPVVRHYNPVIRGLESVPVRITRTHP